MVKRVARVAAPGGGVVGGYVHAGGKLGVLVALATAGRRRRPAGARQGRRDARRGGRPDARRGRPRRGARASCSIRSARSCASRPSRSGKPPAVIEKIVEGQINKFLSEICLVEQPFVKDPDRTIGDLLREAALGWAARSR